MPPIQILIVDLPKLLRDIVHDTLTAEPDMEVVGEVAAGESIEREVARTGASVVIVDSDNDEAAADPPSLLVRRAEHLRVLALGSDGRNAFLQELRPARIQLGELSPSRLIQTIRRPPMTSSDD